MTPIIGKPIGSIPQNEKFSSGATNPSIQKEVPADLSYFNNTDNNGIISFGNNWNNDPPDYQLCNYRVKHYINERQYREEDIVEENGKLYFISRGTDGEGLKVLLSSDPAEIAGLRNIYPVNMDLINLEQQNTGNCFFVSALASALKHEDPRYLDKLVQGISYDTATEEYSITIPAYKNKPETVVRVKKADVDNYLDPEGSRPANSNAKFTVLMELASLEYAQKTEWSRSKHDKTTNPNSLSYTESGWLVDGLRIVMPEGSEIIEDIYVGEGSNITTLQKKKLIDTTRHEHSNAITHLGVKMPGGDGHAVQFLRYTPDGQSVVVVNPWDTSKEQTFSLKDVYIIAHGIPPFKSTDNLVAGKIDNGHPVDYDDKKTNEKSDNPNIKKKLSASWLKNLISNNKREPVLDNILCQLTQKKTQGKSTDLNKLISLLS